MTYASKSEAIEASYKYYGEFSKKTRKLVKGMKIYELYGMWAFRFEF